MLIVGLAPTSGKGVIDDAVLGNGLVVVCPPMSTCVCVPLVRDTVLSVGSIVVCRATCSLREIVVVECSVYRGNQNCNYRLVHIVEGVIMLIGFKEKGEIREDSRRCLCY